MTRAEEILRTYWGHQQLRPAQKKAIEALGDKKDVVALLPTGGGKSVCFQIPPLLEEGLCLVVSPLISLMQDQVDSLKRKGIKAMMLSGHLPYKELNRLLDNCTYGGYKFVYISPERLQNNLVQQRLQQMNINLVAIDEAHCISEWGHDFRPAYRKISVLKEDLPDVNFIALTATATQPVLNDIVNNLGLDQPQIVKKSFERKNISLLIQRADDKTYALRRFLEHHSGPSIVYVRSRKLTLQLSKFLNNCNIPSKAYHGGMTRKQKKQLLGDWQRERFRVMVATNAFGMGIDKANVRQVIHYHLPDSLESYYQEVGRAGRDDRPSKGVLIYNDADILKLKDQFLTQSPTGKNVKQIYKKLNSYFSIAYGEGHGQEFNFNFLDFCTAYGFNTYLVYNVLQFLDRLGVLRLSREFHQRTELYFKVSHRRLTAILDKNKSFEKLIHPLLRMQGGVFDYKTSVNLNILQKRSGLSRQKINSILKELEALDIIDLTLADQDSTVAFLVPREDNYTINPLLSFINKYYQSKKNKIKAVIDFVQSDDSCKSKQLLAYFGEEKNEDCHQCSVCMKPRSSSQKRNNQSDSIRRDLMALLHDKPASSKELLLQLDYPERAVLNVLRHMIDREDINLNRDNTYYIS